MPYITSIERSARAIGRDEGVLENLRENVIDVLQVRFETVPTSLASTIAQLEDVTLLKSLHRQAIAIASLEAFQQLIPTSESPEDANKA